MYMFYKRVTIENKDHFLCFSQIAGERYLQKNHNLSSLLSSSLNNEDDCEDDENSYGSSEDDASPAI